MHDLSMVSEIEITYKPKVKASNRIKITNSGTSFDILRKSWDDNKIEYVEEFKILLLDQGNKVLGIKSISVGGVAGTVVDPKVIFQAALKANASNIILCHNHPSGNLNPSEADKMLTKKIVQGGKFLDIKILDHIIVTDEKYLSFSDEGLMY